MLPGSLLFKELFASVIYRVAEEEHGMMRVLIQEDSGEEYGLHTEAMVRPRKQGLSAMH